MDRLLSTAGGALMALLGALGCGATPPHAPPVRLSAQPVVQPEAQPKARPSRAAVAQLFAGAEGTCRVQANARVECWGHLPEGLAALIGGRRLRELAFFG